MICAINTMDPGACNQHAIEGDPLCKQHRELVIGRAMGDPRRAQKAAAALVVQRCLVPEERPEKSGMMPEKQR